MILISRTQWGARRPKYRNVADLSRPSTAHWNGPTLTVGGQSTWDHSKCASLVRGIQNFHMDSRGWSDIAYNFLVCPHGYVFEGRGLNVINGANGTNTGNKTSHAICTLAGEGNPFPDSEKQAYRDAVGYISAHTRAPNDCIGHRDHKATACPGDERYHWVHAGMPGGSAPAPTPTPAPSTPSSPSTLEYDMDTIDLRNAHVTVVRGRHVDNLQGLLIATWAVVVGVRPHISGMYVGGGYSLPDGIAGPSTKAALVAFQQHVGLNADAICGPKTWKALIEF